MRFENWILKRARKADAQVFLEEALYVDRGARYLLQRLGGITATRVFQTLLIVVEFFLFAGILSQKNLTQVYFWSQVSALAAAFWWGALEPFRSFVAENHKASDKRVLLQRIRKTFHFAGVLSLGVAVSGGLLLFVRHGWNSAPWHLHSSFLVAVLFRAVLEFPLRSLYSLVYSMKRVYRPLWVNLAADVCALGILLASWNLFGIWGFSWALGASAFLRAAVTVFFVRRTFLHSSLPLDWKQAVRCLSPFRKPPAVAALVSWSSSVAYGCTRISPWLAIPALAFTQSEESYGVSLGIALHLASPLLGYLSDWAQVFYPDFKRLRVQRLEEASRRLLSLLNRGSFAIGGFATVWSLFLWSFVQRDSSWLLYGSFVPVIFLRALLSPFIVFGLATGRESLLALCGILVSLTPFPLFYFSTSAEGALLILALFYGVGVFGFAQWSFKAPVASTHCLHPEEFARQISSINQVYKLNFLERKGVSLALLRRELDALLAVDAIRWCYPSPAVCVFECKNAPSRAHLATVLGGAIRSLQSLNEFSVKQEYENSRAKTRRFLLQIPGSLQIERGKAAGQAFYHLSVYARRSLLHCLVSAFPWSIESLERHGYFGFVDRSRGLEPLLFLVPRDRKKELVAHLGLGRTAASTPIYEAIA